MQARRKWESKIELIRMKANCQDRFAFAAASRQLQIAFTYRDTVCFPKNDFYQPWALSFSHLQSPFTNVPNDVYQPWYKCVFPKNDSYRPQTRIMIFREERQ